MRVAHYLLAVILGLFVSTVTVDGWFFRRTVNRAKNYARDFYGGSRDMWRNYRDMRDANTIGADKYFHSRGNYEAANRGTGGRHAAALISNAREAAQLGTGAFKSVFTDKKWSDVMDDYRADQEANKWGRSGGDPNRYRPNGLHDKY